MAPPAIDFRLPSPTQRISVMGHTGSGKTHFAMWALSHANWNKRPWLIVDYKGDPWFHHLNKSVPKLISEIDVTDKVPRQPDLYIVQPLPTEQQEVNDLIMRVWAKGKTGLFFDEGHMLPKAPRYPAVPAVLSQGRSKSIPVIMVSQKPSWISQFAFSEADYFSLFHLQDWRDRQRAMEFIPVNLENPLPHRHSYYHSVENQSTIVLRPLPDRDTIVSTFRRRLGERPSLWSGFTSHGLQKTSSRWF